MKKSVVFGLISMLAGVASATIVSANTFGMLRVDSSEKETIIAVPWLAASTSLEGEGIKVTDVIKTANLTAGDMLLYYNGNGSYQAWTLNLSKDSSKVWESTRIASAGNGLPVASPGANDATLTRGNALILIRQNYDNVPIYLFGQVPTATASTTIMANAWTLIAPPTVADYNINSAKNWDATCENDMILVPGANSKTEPYIYRNNAWGRYDYDATERKETWAPGVSIPAGTGIWYKRGTNSAITVTW